MGPNEDAVHSRAELLPEELAAGGSVDPEAQAQAILDDSEQRIHAAESPAGELDPSSAEYQSREHRHSEDTV